MENFTDTEFMTAKEKTMVYKTWVRFIDLLADGDIINAEKAFSNRLYTHLMQNCGYIAHYDKNGFWHTYFEGYVNVDSFFKNWENDYKGWMNDYSDINKAMQEYVAPKIKDIIALQYSKERKDAILQAKHAVKQYGLTAEILGVAP